MHPHPAAAWRIVGIAMLGLCLSTGPVVNYTFGVFTKPLAADFKAGRAAISLAIALMNIFVTLSSPVVGRLADRFGSRPVIVVSIFATSACLFGLSLLRPPIWQLYAVFILTGIVGAGAAPVAYSRVVANWFDHQRGFALGLASTGAGLGVFVMPPLAQWIIDHFGWRMAYTALAVLPLAIAAPLVWFGLHEHPASSRHTSAGPGLTFTEALQTRTFWQLFAIFGAASACGNGLIAHLVPLLTDQGMTGQAAALTASSFGAAAMAGRIGIGYLADRIFAPRLAALLFAGAGAGLLILCRSAGTAGTIVAAGLLGLALGAEIDVMPFLVSRYFGMRAMGALYGFIFSSFTLGAAAGQYLFGVGFDATGAYRVPLATAAGVMCLAILGTLTLGPYRYAQAETKQPA